jgi:hypothetical protein
MNQWTERHGAWTFGFGQPGAVFINKRVGGGDVWFVSCFAIGILDRALEAETAADARIEGMNHVRNRLKNIALTIDEACRDAKIAKERGR